ncbi:MAG: hypothetical protein HKM93_05585 [Desulfobacteraceae bacterium]|nr:hypothetical protein [Desulfobacteraceae bacterium]
MLKRVYSPPSDRKKLNLFGHVDPGLRSWQNSDYKQPYFVPPNHRWHSYIAVTDADNCAKKALELGGKVLVPPHDVPDAGRICVVSDPTGAVAHLMQPAERD